MNLEDVIDPEYGLQQDEWSLSKPTFGEDGQLEGQLTVVGWSGKGGIRKNHKLYILKCTKCGQDSELFGGGYFKNPKADIVRGKVPCGCAKNPRWSEGQYALRCSRKAEEIGYKFLGFIGEWKGKSSKISMFCEKHGEWDSGNIDRLVNMGRGCPRCGVDAGKKSDHTMIALFLSSGAFHPDTKFWRSDRKTKQGDKSYWFMYCPRCEGSGESQCGSLQRGYLPCDCSRMRQQEAYINWLVDNHGNAVAIKFGVARDSKQRIKQQNSKCIYTLKQHSIYSFPSVASCKQAERECKKELETGVVLKRDMPDGWTETTWSYNIGKVKSIYERNGGVMV